MYKCPICGNSDKKYIGYLNSNPYCRKCIKFSNNREVINDISVSENVNVNLKRKKCIYPYALY